MLITCPACASDYTIDPARIGAAGRKVRCAACRGSWFLTAPPEPEPSTDGPPPDEPADFVPIQAEAEAVPELPVVIEAEPTPPRPRARPMARKGRRRVDAGVAAPRPGRRLALAALAAAGAALAVIPLRATVVAALPGTASLYRAVGLPVNLVGLSIEEVVSSLGQENGAPVLVVTGIVRNVSGSDRPVLPLQLAIASEAGQTLYSWSARAAEAELASGAQTKFRVRLASPPPAGRRIEVTFREGRDRLGVALH